MGRAWLHIGVASFSVGACSAVSMQPTAASPGSPEDVTQVDNQGPALGADNEVLAQPLSCAEVVAGSSEGSVEHARQPAGSGAFARLSREKGTLDEDRGFGSARQLLDMVAEQRRVSVPLSSGQADGALLDLTIDFAHHPLQVSGERWSSFWVLESTPPGVTPQLAVPICLVVRSADGTIAQQWNAELLTSDEPGRAVLSATAALTPPQPFEAPVSQTCTTLDVQLDMRAESTRASIQVSTNALQTCASWSTERRPVLSADGLPGPEEH